VPSVSRSLLPPRSTLWYHDFIHINGVSTSYSRAVVVHRQLLLPSSSPSLRVMGFNLFHGLKSLLVVLTFALMLFDEPSLKHDMNFRIKT
jgi:hypothetical protein